MDVKVTPAKLSGKITPPPSKSVAHRLIICASLCDNESVISNISFSKDIIATINAMRSLGAEIETSDDTVIVKGMKSTPETAVIDCCESGSTLRFLIPIAAALGVDCKFSGEGKLPSRPITPYLSELTANGIKFDYNNTMPFSISGKLKSGIYSLRGDISSQFISGLLFALPLLDGDSEIILTSELESKPYVDITIDALNTFGISVTETPNGYRIKGNQVYKAVDKLVCEADFSQAAFFYVANALGSNIEICGMNEKSSQGDKKIVEILGEIGYNNKDRVSDLKPFEVSVKDIPDLVPILTVLACYCNGESVIYDAKRLRIKESDRLMAISDCLIAMGADIEVFDDKLKIYGGKRLKGTTIDAFNDHRIAMSAAIAATISDGDVIISGAECINKSYPDFFEDYNKLGGKANVINLE